MTKTQIITAAGSIMLIGATAFYDFGSADKGEDKKIEQAQSKEISGEVKKDKGASKVDIKYEEDKKTAKREKTDNIPSYKDIFTEDHLVDMERKMRDDEEFVKLMERDTKKLIDEAETIIAENNLKVDYRELTEEEKGQERRFNDELKKIEQKLEEFENDI